MLDFSSQDEKDKEEADLRARQFRWPAFMPFFWLGLAAIIGPFAAEEFNFPWFWWLILAAAAILLVIFRKRSPKNVQTIRRFPAVLALAAFALTAMLYQLSLPEADPDNLLYYHNRGEVTVTALVVSPLL